MQEADDPSCSIRTLTRSRREEYRGSRFRRIRRRSAQLALSSQGKGRYDAHVRRRNSVDTHRVRAGWLKENQKG